MSALGAADRVDIAGLLVRRRWAALATLREDGTPLASQVAVAPDPGHARLVLHLSDLAEHTRNLRRRPAVSLVAGDPDLGQADPQTLARLSVNARAVVLARPGADFEAARAAYLRASPEAAPRFAFADFHLVVLEVDEAHYVGGFARVHRIDRATMCAIIREADLRVATGCIVRRLSEPRMRCPAPRRRVIAGGSRAGSGGDRVPPGRPVRTCCRFRGPGPGARRASGSV